MVGWTEVCSESYIECSDLHFFRISHSPAPYAIATNATRQSENQCHNNCLGRSNMPTQRGKKIDFARSHGNNALPSISLGSGRSAR